MKQIVIAMTCMLITSLAVAQKKEWKQMEDFHNVISKTFHPAEEGNFKPLKDKADSLVLTAVSWQTAAVPAGYNEKLVKPKLAKLVTDCKAVKSAVAQNKDDATLKKLITAAHATFHGIMEKGEE